MNKFKRELLILAVLLIAISAISIVYYGKMMDAGVEKVPIHWNINNEADNFASPIVACLFGPGSIVLIMLLTFLMSRKEYSGLEKKSTRFVILLIASFLVFLNWVALKSAVGYNSDRGFDISMIHLGFGLLFILLGNQLGKIPYSRWIGIRVPATLNNEEVWNRVHSKAGKYMVISGIIILIALFVGDKPWIWVFYIPLIVSFVIMIFVLPIVEKSRYEKEIEGK